MEGNRLSQRAQPDSTRVNRLEDLLKKKICHEVRSGLDFHGRNFLSCSTRPEQRKSQTGKWVENERFS